MKDCPAGGSHAALEARGLSTEAWVSLCSKRQKKQSERTGQKKTDRLVGRMWQRTSLLLVVSRETLLSKRCHPVKRPQSLVTRLLSLSLSRLETVVLLFSVYN